MNFLFMFFTHLKFFIIMPSFVVHFPILILLHLVTVSVSAPPFPPFSFLLLLLILSQHLFTVRQRVSYACELEKFACVF